MTNFVKISNGVVVQIQPYIEAGFVEAPDHVVCDMIWDGHAFIDPPPSPVSVEAIKAECRRRILLIMSEDQQRNTLAAGQAAMMQYGSVLSDWPIAIREDQASALESWREIERLRSRSNEIEKMSPLPLDVSDDSLWLAS